MDVEEGMVVSGITLEFTLHYEAQPFGYYQYTIYPSSLKLTIPPSSLKLTIQLPDAPRELLDIFNEVRGCHCVIQ